MIVVISGMPGAGKTTLAYTIAMRAGIEQVTSTDVLKEAASFFCDDAMMLTTSHDAWRLLDSLNHAKVETCTLIKGYQAHTNRYLPLLEHMCACANHSGKQIVLEGVQISPQNFAALPEPKIGFYITIPSHIRKRRLKQKNEKRSVHNKEWIDNFQIICAIDEFAKKDAMRNGMMVIENDDFEKTTHMILDRMTQTTCEVVR